MKAYTRIFESLLIESIFTLLFSAAFFLLNIQHYSLLLTIGLISLGVCFVMAVAGNYFKLFIHEPEWE